MRGKEEGGDKEKNGRKKKNAQLGLSTSTQAQMEVANTGMISMW